MPEGDSLHREALRLYPTLVDQRVRSLLLVRHRARTDGLVGTTIVNVEARGKNLLVHFAVGWSLHVHLKMNGRVRVYPRGNATKIALSAASVILETDAHRVVVYSAPVARVLRTSDLLGDLHFRGLGPDLLAPRFELQEAVTRLMRHGETPLGDALIDQSVIAGIGNVWKSELCFSLRLDPFAPVQAHDEVELCSLLSLARTQMFDNVYGPKRSMPDPFAGRGERKTRLDHRQGEQVLSVYERAGKACYDCGAPIAMSYQGELRRSTYWCPQCQPSRGGR